MSTLYGSSVADSILTTACLMAPTSGGGETSKQTTITGTAGAFAEITSQGLTVADRTAIPGTPTGNGWIYYPGAGTFAAGNWSASVTLQFVLHGSPNQTTLRFFRRSGGGYTLIGSIVATTATLAKTTYTFAATSMAAITFGASDGLYMDLWWDDASVDPSGDDPTIYVSSSAAAGVANDMQITTSTFSSVAGALAGTLAAHGTLAGTLAVTGVGKIAGQTFTNGISNFIFGAHDHGEPGMSVPYPSSAQITLAKQLGGPPMLLRTFFNSTATDAQITARLNAISDCGGIPLICLQTPTNATFNAHVVTFVGSGCNLYEFGNEPDGTATPLTVAAYSAAWNAQIPVLRSINPSASFLGPATTKGGDAYRRTWLSNCASSGVKPDGVTTHDYPCTGVSTTSACLLLDNLGARVQAVRKDVESVFPGQNIAVGLSEWNVDAHFPMESYSQTEPFVSQFYQDVLQSLIAVNADLACVFSLFAGGSNYAMINTSTGAKTGFYTAFQHAVSALMNFSTLALVQSATGSVGSANASSVTVPTRATGSANLLVAFVMVQGASVTITPPSGWAQVDTTQGISGGTGSVAMFYRQNSAPGVTSHVFSFSASCNASVAFEEWSGVATAGALDQEVATQNAKSATALTGTTGPLAGSGELAIFGLAVPATNVLTYSGITNGYREDTSANATSSQATRAEATLFYKTSTTSSATSSGATMSGTGASGNTTILAVFRAAAAGVSGALTCTMAGAGTLAGTLTAPYQVFPSNNIWNCAITAMPVHASSSTFITSMGTTNPLTFSQQFPITFVAGSQGNVAIHLGTYASESDVGPSPIPPSALVEGNTDKHVIVVDTGTKKLYELYHAVLQGDNSWNADQQSIWDLSSNALRTNNWTSCDAAGLPIFAGLLRYEEVITAGVIKHALRLVVNSTNTPNLHTWPARHDDGATSSNNPPYGSRLRLKASASTTGFSAAELVIATALKTYGAMIADRDTPAQITLVSDVNAGWASVDLTHLGNLHVSDFEVVDVSSFIVDANSGQVSGVLACTMAGAGTLSGTLVLPGGMATALSGECDGVGTLSGTLSVPPTIRGTYTVVIGGLQI